MKHNKFSLLALAVLSGSVFQAAMAFDAVTELARLKAKHRDALDRCSSFEAMQKAKEFQEIDDAQDETVKAKDWAAFERVARAGISLKTQPDIWYYNLACVLSRQKKIAEALVALEQSVASGYLNRAHVEKDGDMENLRGEKRYAELLQVMDLNRRNYRPKAAVKVEDGCFMPTDATTEWDIKKGEEYFSSRLSIPSNACSIVYMDRNCPHGGSIRKVLPGLDLVEMVYPEEMKRYGQDVGTANFRFLFEHGSLSIPAIVASDVSGSLYGGSSVSAEYGIDHAMSWRLGSLAFFNVLQVYSAGRDYGADGFDRYVANLPFAVNYVAEDDAQRFFIDVLARSIRALPDNVRIDAIKCGGLCELMQWLLRHSQKHVRQHSDYLTGVSHPPAFYKSSIDAGRMIEMAKKLKSLTPAAPAMEVSGYPAGWSEINELETCSRGILSDTQLSGGAFGSAFAFRGLGKTFKLRLTLTRIEGDMKLIWKVLQGDENKVRIKPLSDGKTFEIEVDYHSVFDITDAHGKRMKTSRVDIGFFYEWDVGLGQIPGGNYTIPYIVSVVMPPHDTRIYDKNGRLLVADYSKPQIHPTNFVSKAFTRGYWRDTYHYDKDGEFRGWTRDEPGHLGTAVEWNDDYMEIVECDELGRPSRLSRPRIYAWTQDEPAGESDESPSAISTRVRSILQENSDRVFEPVTWICEYASTNDFVGKIKTIPYCGYSPRRFNPYADFGTETNGFAYPLAMELDDGWNHYELSKHGAYITNQEFANLKCERGKEIPMAMSPKKMKFSSGERRQWRWPDIRDVECSFSTNLVKIPDGAYRLKGTDEDGEEYLMSISKTRRLWNELMSTVAAKRMDEAGFSRCSINELRLILEHANNDEFATNSVLYVVGDDREFVRERLNAVTGWRIIGDVCFVVRSDGKSGTDTIPGWENRTYSFVRIDTNDVERTVDMIGFGFFPPEDMVKAFLHGRAGKEGDAENDLAVLFYSGAANFYHYSENDVLCFLNRAARKSNAVAMHNLGVFYDNRKDSERAARHYRLAGQLDKHMKYAEIFETVFGETNITSWVQFLEKEVAQKHAEAYVELALERMNAMKDVGDDASRRKILEADAVALLSSGAAAGDLMALNIAATASEKIGVTNAVKWAQDAVATGFADENAYCELANAYRNGLGGLEMNTNKTVELLRFAAEELESLRAQFEYADYYLSGDKTEIPALAMMLLGHAAEKGYPPAVGKLGELLVTQGVKGNDDEFVQQGITRLREAIDNGIPSATMFMAARLELGDVPQIKKDVNEALKLYSRLAESGDPAAQKKVDALRENKRQTNKRR